MQNLHENVITTTDLLVPLIHDKQQNTLTLVYELT